MSCVFNNGSLVYTASARVLGSYMATCAAPAWPLSINSTNGGVLLPLLPLSCASGNRRHTACRGDADSATCRAGTVVDLRVATGGCAFRHSFGYYLLPLVTRVHPQRGPRYGSFPVTVYLEDSLEHLIDGKVGSRKVMHTGRGVSMRVILQQHTDRHWCPAVELLSHCFPAGASTEAGHVCGQRRRSCCGRCCGLEGAAGNGSNLDLPANVTADRRALMAMTPAECAPLAAGTHALRLSLNGQFLSANRTNMVPPSALMQDLDEDGRPSFRWTG